MKMTDDEKRIKMTERNAAICAYYVEGHKLAEVCSRFKLGKQRVIQILQTAGVWRPYEKGKRTKFLGVSVSEGTKAGLSRVAGERGVSVSRLASDALDEMVSRVEE